MYCTILVARCGSQYYLYSLVTSIDTNSRIVIVCIAESSIIQFGEKFSSVFAEPL